jgi:vacuolar iron transporter family protein
MPEENFRDPIVHLNVPVLQNAKLNWLRAAVLGANDGVVSVSSVIVGVAASGSAHSAVLASGVAAIVAGALSMATGEYVSVSTQKDTEKAHAEKHSILQNNEEEFSNPWHAAWASALAFFAGAIFPLLALVFSPEIYKIPTTFISVFLVLVATGSLSAHVGGANKTKATIRVVLGGMFAMSVTFLIGKLFGNIMF